jgi:hypothetical protein
MRLKSQKSGRREPKEGRRADAMSQKSQKSGCHEPKEGRRADALSLKSQKSGNFDLPKLPKTAEYSRRLEISVSSVAPHECKTYHPNALIRMSKLK